MGNGQNRRHDRFVVYKTPSPAVAVFQKGRSLGLRAGDKARSSECGPCLFLKEHLPKKIPQEHTLV